MRLIPHSEILRIHGAAVAIGLGASRDALLGGLPQDLTAGFPNAATAASQLLSDLHRLNEIEQFADGGVPLLIWLGNALALAGPRREAEVFREALRSAPRRRFARRAAWLGIPLALGLLVVGLVLRPGASIETKGADAGPLSAVPASPAPSLSTGSGAATATAVTSGSEQRSQLVTTAAWSRSSGAPTAESAPPLSALSTIPRAVPEVRRGVATRSGAFWSLRVPREELGPAQFVCLDPSPRPEALMGAQPTCSLLPGPGMAQCSRSGNAHDVPIGDSVPWRWPCP